MAKLIVNDACSALTPVAAVFCLSPSTQWNFGFNLMSLGVSREINMSRIYERLASQVRIGALSSCTCASHQLELCASAPA